MQSDEKLTPFWKSNQRSWPSVFKSKPDPSTAPKGTEIPSLGLLDRDGKNGLREQQLGSGTRNSQDAFRPGWAIALEVRRIHGGVKRARYFVLICAGEVTTISGFPLCNAIFPDTETIRPLYCCGCGNCPALAEGI